MIIYHFILDSVKLTLAKDGVCEHIYKLLNSHNIAKDTDELRGLLKMSLDLIILILTGDDSMNYLYNNSDLLKQIELCLDSNNVDILTANVLAIGNFARTDSHCIDMVKSDILKKMINILRQNSGAHGNIKLQHALLSSLKNLIMPKPNKKLVIDMGLVDIMLVMLENNQLPVIFKLLGTFRMVVDKQGT